MRTILTVTLIACLALAALGLSAQMRDEADRIEAEIASIRAEIRDREMLLRGLRCDLATLRAQAIEQESRLERVMDELSRWELLDLEATAYAPLDPLAVEGMCHDGDPTSTATGTYPGPGTIAVNPEVIPYGSRMLIQDYGWGIAEDTGGAMRAREDLIDLCMDTREEALAWGRQRVQVIIERRRSE